MFKTILAYSLGPVPKIGVQNLVAFTIECAGDIESCPIKHISYRGRCTPCGKPTRAADQQQDDGDAAPRQLMVTQYRVN